MGLTMCLSTGRTEFDTWRAPDPALIKAIASERIRSAIEAKDDGVIFIVENIDWLSANHVELDIGTYHKSIQLNGSTHVQLKFLENKWVIADQGGCYTIKLENADYNRRRSPTSWLVAIKARLRVSYFTSLRFLVGIFEWPLG